MPKIVDSVMTGMSDVRGLTAGMIESVMKPYPYRKSARIKIYTLSEEDLDTIINSVECSVPNIKVLASTIYDSDMHVLVIHARNKVFRIYYEGMIA